MTLFNFGKRIEEKRTPTCCSGSTEPTAEDTLSCCCGKPVEGSCYIKILGAGCKSCHDQYEYAKKAVSNLGLGIEVEYITDMEKVMEYGVISMPAIVVNDKVAVFGKVLKTAEVEKLLADLLL